MIPKLLPLSLPLWSQQTRQSIVFIVDILVVLKVSEIKGAGGQSNTFLSLWWQRRRQQNLSGFSCWKLQSLGRRRTSPTSLRRLWEVGPQTIKEGEKKKRMMREAQKSRRTCLVIVRNTADTLMGNQPEIAADGLEFHGKNWNIKIVQCYVLLLLLLSEETKLLQTDLLWRGATSYNALQRGHFVPFEERFGKL